MTFAKYSLALALVGLGTPAALAETQVIRPGECSPAPAIVYVVKKPAPLVFLSSDDPDVSKSVAIYLEMTAPGWASRRLMSRFDLKPPARKSPVENSGSFCIEGQNK